MTTQNENELFDTTTHMTSYSEMMEASLTNPVPAKEDTISKQPQDARTVPVTSANKSIKLRYVPREQKLDQGDSSTQT